MCNPGSALAVQYGAPFSGANGSGSGRFWDVIFPSWPQSFSGAPSAAVGGRLQFQAGNINATQTNVGGAPALNINVVNGVPGIGFTTTAVPAFVVNRLNNAPMVGPLTRANIGGYASDLQAYRFIWVSLCANNPAGGDTSDCGCYLIQNQGVNLGPIVSGALGFGFHFSTPNLLRWATRDGGGLLQTTLNAAFDFTQWHTFEIWLVCSTIFGDAFLFAVVDGVLQTLPTNQRSWAAGTRLPPQQLVTGQVGFESVYHTNLTIASGMLLQQQRAICGPTLASLF